MAAPDRAPAAPVSVSARADDPGAATALLAALAPVAPGFVLLLGPGDALPAIAAELRHGLGAGCSIVGCSSAGEIGPDGYARGSVVALGFPASSFRAVPLALRDLAGMPASDWMAELRALWSAFAPAPRRRVFGLLLADGLAQREDILVATLDAALPNVPVVGGSAGDGLDFERTCLVLDGFAMSDVAIFLLAETDFDLSEISFAHFSPTPVRAVVTAADPAGRLILELNAEPAAEEYARLAGLDGPLTPTDFARHPLLLRMGKRHHVRAISSVTPEGGLNLMSAIDTGSVLTLGQSEDMTQGLTAAFEALPRLPAMVLGFDCILRRLALERAGRAGAMADLFQRWRVAGFNTYGEQHSGMHVNQTFVGLAFLPPEAV